LIDRSTTKSAMHKGRAYQLSFKVRASPVLIVLLIHKKNKQTNIKRYLQ
jgi:hypothetical protein